MLKTLKVRERERVRESSGCVERLFESPHVGTLKLFLGDLPKPHVAQPGDSGACLHAYSPVAENKPYPNSPSHKSGPESGSPKGTHKPGPLTRSCSSLFSSLRSFSKASCRSLCLFSSFSRRSLICCAHSRSSSSRCSAVRSGPAPNRTEKQEYPESSF